MYDSIKELAELTDETNVVLTTLGELRTALGYDRLGKYVLGQISAELDAEKLGYFPTWRLEWNDEPRQHQEIRVYRTNTDVGKVITAVVAPTPQGDAELNALEDSGVKATLDKIKALVCE